MEPGNLLLQELAIAMNCFGEEGAKALKSAIIRMPVLHTLLAKDNDIPEDALVAIYEGIAATKRFQRVDLPQVLLQHCQYIFAAHTFNMY
jgi:hypothetical protein